MGLAAIGGRDRSPWLARAMTAKVLFDVANAARLTRDQWTKYRAFCIWCLIAAGATFAMLPLALTSRPAGNRRALPSQAR